MSKAVIHIGTHKTATTLIQDVLAKNRSILKQNNIIYPTIGRFSGHHMLASEWIAINQSYLPIGGHDKTWQYLVNTYANSDKTVVLSSEEFSRAFPTRVNMAELRERLSAFDQVEIVCFLRDQKSFLQSIYLEISKGRHPNLPEVMLEEAKKDYLADGLWLDYNLLYDHLLTAFSKDEITFVPYNKAIESKGGILEGFLKLLGFSLGIETLNLGPKLSNVSEDPLKIWAANMINAPKPAPEELLQAIQNRLEQLYGTPLKTTLFTPYEVQQFAETFDPLNRSFCARLSDQQPDFELPLITFEKDTPHRGMLSGSTWLKQFGDILPIEFR
jgi:hypothetical protein